MFHLLRETGRRFISTFASVTRRLLKNILLLFLVVLSATAAAQKKTPSELVDSLEAALVKARGADRIKTLNALGEARLTIKLDTAAQRFFEQAMREGAEIKEARWSAVAEFNLSRFYYFSNQLEKAEKHSRAAVAALERSGDSVQVLRSYSHLGNVLGATGHAGESVAYHKKALAFAIALKDRQLEANSYGNLGLAHDQAGDLKTSLEHCIKAAGIFHEMKDTVAIITSNSNIGSLYMRLNQAGQAIVYFRKALDMSRRRGSKKAIASSLLKVGQYFSHKGVHDSSMRYFNEALAMRTAMNDKRGIANVLNEIGGHYWYTGNMQEAIKYYSQAVKLFTEVGDIPNVAISTFNVGDSYFQMKKYPAAAAEYQSALAIARKGGIRQLQKECYKKLSESYFHSGNKDLAYEYLSRYTSLSDSLLNETTSKQFAEMSARFEATKKENEIKDLEKSKQIQALELEQKNSDLGRQRTFLIYAAILILLVGVLAFFIFKNYKRAQKAYGLVARQKTVIEEKNKDITDSIRYAKNLQNAILPHDDLVYAHLKDCFVLFMPKDIVSGDFYWMSPSGDRVLFAVVDCTGHGVPGAIMSIVGYNALNNALKDDQLSPSGILGALDRHVTDTFQQQYKETTIRDGMDVALCAIDRQRMKLYFAGANNPMYLVRNGALTEIKGTKRPIGNYSDGQPAVFEQHELPLEKGDLVYIFSDGYADQFGGPDGKKFKYTQLKSLLVSVSAQPMFSQKQVLEKTIGEWRGNLDQVDDICIIGVRV